MRVQQRTHTKLLTTTLGHPKSTQCNFNSCSFNCWLDYRYNPGWSIQWKLILHCITYDSYTCLLKPIVFLYALLFVPCIGHSLDCGRKWLKIFTITTLSQDLLEVMMCMPFNNNYLCGWSVTKYVDKLFSWGNLMLVIWVMLLIS